MSAIDLHKNGLDLNQLRSPKHSILNCLLLIEEGQEPSSIPHPWIKPLGYNGQMQSSGHADGPV